MSEQNVELARRAVETYNEHDTEAYIALCDPKIELQTTMGVGGAIYHGHDGMRRYFGDLEDAWGKEFRVEPEAYFDLGEQTLLFYVARGRGSQSGVEVTRPRALIQGWRDGLLVYVKVYVDRAEALSELGISEDALEPIAP